MRWLPKLLLAVLGIAALGGAVLVLMGRRSGAGEVDVTVKIRRPAAVVFPWLHEPQKALQWVGWLKEIRPLAPGKDGVGAKEVWVMEDRNNGGALVEVTGESTLFDPPRRLAAKLSVPDAFDGEVVYELSETGGETTLRSRARYRYQHWLARMLEPVITPEARKKTEADLATLKQKVESQP